MTPSPARERVTAALQGSQADRPPVCFWRHFDIAEDPDALADATLEYFVRQHDLDLVKLMPDLGHPYGVGSVAGREDWARVADRPDDTAWVERHLRCLARVLHGLHDDRPVVVTLFSPVATAAHLAPNLTVLIEHLERWPDEVGGALAALGDLLADLAASLVDAGADGIFLGMQGCGVDEMRDDLYSSLVLPAEAMPLHRVPDAMLRVAHLHADHPIRWDAAAAVGANVISFSDGPDSPSLADVRDTLGLTTMGGWDEHGAIANGSPDAVMAEGVAALQGTGGRNHILAAGCSLPSVPNELLVAARATPGAWAQATTP